MYTWFHTAQPAGPPTQLQAGLLAPLEDPDEDPELDEPEPEELEPEELEPEEPEEFEPEEPEEFELEELEPEEPDALELDDAEPEEPDALELDDAEPDELEVDAPAPDEPEPDPGEVVPEELDPEFEPPSPEPAPKSEHAWEPATAKSTGSHAESHRMRIPTSLRPGARREPSLKQAVPRGAWLFAPWLQTANALRFRAEQ